MPAVHPRRAKEGTLGKHTSRRGRRGCKARRSDLNILQTDDPVKFNAPHFIKSRASWCMRVKYAMLAQHM